MVDVRITLIMVFLQVWRSIRRRSDIKPRAASPFAEEVITVSVGLSDRFLGRHQQARWQCRLCHFGTEAAKCPPVYWIHYRRCAHGRNIRCNIQRFLYRKIKANERECYQLKPFFNLFFHWNCGAFFQGMVSGQWSGMTKKISKFNAYFLIGDCIMLSWVTLSRA